MSEASFSSTTNNVYRVRNWQQLLGPQKGKSGGGFLGRLARITLSPCPGMSTLVRKRLFNLPQGVASYSVWLLLVQIAAQTSIPGCFLDEETPLTAEDLSLLTDVPLEEMRVALDNLSRPGVRLIECVDLQTVLSDAAATVSNVRPLPTSSPDALETLPVGIASVPRSSVGESTPSGWQSTGTPDAIASDVEKPSVAALAEIRAANPFAKELAAQHLITKELGTNDLADNELRAKGADSLAVAASSDVAQDIAEAEQQLAKLMGVFDQVQQMKQQVNTLSGPLQSHIQTRKHRKRRS